MGDRPGLREQPHRLLFPLGALLASAGVIPWLLLSLGITDLYRPIFGSLLYRSMFHPLAEVEGFLTCFAVGALFTAVPRLTNRAPPSAWQIAVAVSAPIGILACALADAWAAGQILWAVLLLVVIDFTVRRLGVRGASTPEGFWIVLGLLMAVSGALLAAIGSPSVADLFWLHQVGRGLLLQGFFTALVLGASGLLLRSMGPAPDGPTLGNSLWAHAFAGLLFVASFFVSELITARLGFALRAAITFAVVAAATRRARPQGPAGWLGALARISLWMLPLGYTCVAILPTYRRAGLHVIYLGCFAALLLTVSTRLSLPPGVRPERLPEPRWPIVFAGGLLGVALLARIILELDPWNSHLWLGTAAACLLSASVPWAALVIGKHRPAR